MNGIVYVFMFIFSYFITERVYLDIKKLSFKVKKDSKDK